jgi:hypothetical protein
MRWAGLEPALFTLWVTGLQPVAFAAQTTNAKYPESDSNRHHPAFEADASTSWAIRANTRGQIRTDTVLFLRQTPPAIGLREHKGRPETRTLTGFRPGTVFKTACLPISAAFRNGESGTRTHAGFTPAI